jgi:16S rRNA U516 pseudouridylate synthase RsuA-like enzyme
MKKPHPPRNPHQIRIRLTNHLATLLDPNDGEAPKGYCAGCVCSRRRAEELIAAGRVLVNGSAVTQLGSKVDPLDSIKVDGKRIRLDQQKIYILLNKPKGYICTLSDPEGRPKVGDLIRGVSQKLFPVGRLDYASEGLLLLTND